MKKVLTSVLFMLLCGAFVLAGCSKESGDPENGGGNSIAYDGQVVDALVSPLTNLRWGMTHNEVSEIVLSRKFAYECASEGNQFYTYGSYSINYDREGGLSFNVPEIWGFNFTDGKLKEITYYVPASDWWAMKNRWTQIANQLGVPFSDQMLLGVGMFGEIATSNCKIYVDKGKQGRTNLCNTASNIFKSLCPEKHRQRYPEMFIVWAVK